MRDKHKSNMGYSAEFVAYMKNAIENRLVPLLVDVGGLPRGEQLGIIRACTHAILLYKDDEGRAAWREILDKHALPLIAELRSSLSEPGKVERTHPYLQGSISGLDRNAYGTDVTFGALLKTVAALFHRDERHLEQVHLRHAQYQPVVARILLEQIAPQRNPPGEWRPEDLGQVASLLPQPPGPISIYGRGPVWLAAMLGAYCANIPATIYDVRLGWIPIPQVESDSVSPNLQTILRSSAEYDFVEINIPGGILEDERLRCAPIQGDAGLILSGKLSRWIYAGLARSLAAHRKWIAIHVPQKEEAIIVYSKSDDFPLGATIKLH